MIKPAGGRGGLIAEASMSNFIDFLMFSEHHPHRLPPAIQPPS
jgi:hypothetical protein